MKKGDIIAIAGFILVLSILMMWCIDISITGMTKNVKKSVLEAYDIDYISLEGTDVGMTNGFFNASPAVMYHIGLYILIISLFSLFLIIVHRELKEE